MAKSKPRIKMPIHERAKQFAPFSPLSGLEKALAEKERIFMPKRDLDNDAIVALNDILSQITVGDSVTAFFYDDQDKTYVTKVGTVFFIDEFNKSIKVSDTVIPFDMLYEITVEN